MTYDELLAKITISSDVCFGKPWIKLRRIERTLMHGAFLARIRLLLACLLVAWIVAMIHPPAAANHVTDSGQIWTYVAGDGIKLFRFDQQTGALAQLSETQDSKPSFLAIHPNGKTLYGVGGELAAFSIDPRSGELTLLNTVPYKEHGLCHVVVDATGANVLSAGYGSGTISVHRINEDGQLGERTAFEQHHGSSVNEKRQKAPHAHSINVDPGNHFAFAADLGIDKIVIYRFAAARGTLEPAKPPAVSVAPGAGPRHFAFHPSSRFAYVINELDSTVTSFRYDTSTGRLDMMEAKTTLPEGVEQENYTAEVVVHPSGRFLYGSNRGHNSIAVFAIDQDSGKIAPVDYTPTGGKWPRNFCIDPSGKFLLAANQKSNNVIVFRIDQQTGKLTRTPHEVEVPSPTCIRFLQPKAS